MSAGEQKLTIVHVDAERGFSGGEVQVFLLMEGLRQRGHKNVLVAPPDSEAETIARHRGFDVRVARMSGDFDLGAVLRLRRAFRDSHADLVHLHTGRATWLGGLAARLAHLPTITTRRMDRRVKRNWRTRLVYQHLVRRAVAISPAVRQRLADAGVDDGLTRMIPSAVDPEAVRAHGTRDNTRRRIGVGEEQHVVLALASLVERKGIDVLVEACARLADRSAVCLVGGEGPARPALEERVRALHLDGRVRFLGRRRDKADLLEACDVFVMPSRREGLGVASLEAMAARRPVVASRVGGLADAVVHERTGLLVPPEDPQALADALDRLLADDELRRRLGDGGPARVAEGHLAEQMVAAYEALYLDVLAERRAS